MTPPLSFNEAAFVFVYFTAFGPIVIWDLIDTARKSCARERARKAELMRWP